MGFSHSTYPFFFPFFSESDLVVMLVIIINFLWDNNWVCLDIDQYIIQILQFLFIFNYYAFAAARSYIPAAYFITYEGSVRCDFFFFFLFFFGGILRCDSCSRTLSILWDQILLIMRSAHQSKLKALFMVLYPYILQFYIHGWDIVNRHNIA